VGGLNGRHLRANLSFERRWSRPGDEKQKGTHQDCDTEENRPRVSKFNAEVFDVFDRRELVIDQSSLARSKRAESSHHCLRHGRSLAHYRFPLSGESSTDDILPVREGAFLMTTTALYRGTSDSFLQVEDSRIQIIQILLYFRGVASRM
jgi:hypothetical protein